MEATVCQLLGQSMAVDANVRLQAELDLRRMETTAPDYAAVLLRCAMETSVEEYVRQISFYTLALKNYVDVHWSHEMENFISPEPPAEIKAVIREGALVGLGDSERNIRTAFASVVAKIAHQDWPEQWPNLLDSLIKLLRNGNVGLTHGVLVSLYELFRVVCSDEVYPAMTRARAIKVFRTCLEALYTIKETQPKQGFFRVLSLQNADETSTLSVIVQSFPSNVKEQIARIIEVVWSDLKHHQELYPLYILNYNGNNTFISESAKDDSPMTWTGQGEDGDATGFATLLIAELEFQHQCVRKKAASSFYEKQEVKVYPYSCRNTLSVVWHEDEDSFNASVRASAFDLFQSLLTRYEEPTLQSMLVSCNQIFTSTIASQAQGNTDCGRGLFRSHWTYSNIIIDKLAQLAPIQFAHQDCLPIDSKSMPTQNRVLLVSSLFSEQYSEEMASNLVQVMVLSLKEGASIPVRVSAMKALNSYSQLKNHSIVGPYREFVISDAMQLIKDASGETLQLVLETIFAFIKAGDLSPQPMATVCATLLETWTRYPNDHICASVIEDIYDYLWSNETVASTVFGASEPFFIQAFTQSEEHPEAVSFALNLITQLAKRRPSSLNGQCLHQVLPPLLTTLLHAQNSQILQQGAQCLSQLLIWDSAFIAHWRDPASGKTGVDAILQYISRLLDPNVSEAAGSTVGNLIIQLLQKASEQVHDNLPMLLQAVMLRLTMSETATQIQSLVMIFAELIRSQTTVTIDFLHTTTAASDNSTGMQLLLSKWCENHPYFHGYFSIKMSIYALSILLANMDDRLAQVRIKGDLMPTTDGRIVTRSRSKSHPDQYTIVPAPVKIIKLLLADLQTDEAPSRTAMTGSRLESEDEEEYEDDEGEWEDIEEEMGPSFQFISDLLTSAGDDLRIGNDDEDDEEEEGVDYEARKKDPVYTMNIKEHVMGLFKSFAQSNPTVLTEMAQQLTPAEQSLLQSIVS
ncbi:armadillo-type protein [Syncephalis plumigaleata]|nr:armadillo-type protein [Syncephalis plumigaleata]